MQILLANRRELSVGVEGASTPGTAATVLFDGTASRYYVYESKFAIDGEVFERKPMRKTLSKLASLIGRRSATISFKVEVRHSGATNTPDAWSSLLKACACTEDTTGVTVAYSPLSEPDSYETLTMWLNIDGVRLGVTGAMGSAVLTGNIGEPMMVEFTFTGVYAGAADQAISDINLPETGIPAVFQGVAFTFGGTGYCFSSLSLDLGNEVSARDCANEAEGILTYLVTDRNPSLTLDPEMQLVATEDFYGTFVGATLNAIAFNAGSDVAFSIPQFQITGISDDERNGVVVAGLSGDCVTTTEAGDNEWLMTLS